MGFRHFPSLLNEIKKLRKLNTYVDCKLVFSDGSMMVHFAKLLASRIWWTGFRDGDTPPDNLVFIFPNQSIKYGLKMINEIYQDSENDNMVHDIEREIPELVVRSNDCSPACLTPPLSRSSSTVRGRGQHLEVNSEGGLCENDDDVDFHPCSAQQLTSWWQIIPETENSVQHQRRDHTVTLILILSQNTLLDHLCNILLVLTILFWHQKSRVFCVRNAGKVLKRISC